METITDWDSAAQQVLQPELMQGESLLWCGRPLHRIVFHSSDAYLIPFSLLWGGFAIFWEWGASGFGHRANGTTQDLFFMLWGVPFILMGQYMIWGRFFYDAWKKSRIFYGVTNRRVIVLARAQHLKLIDTPLRSIPATDLSLRGDGAGTIDFTGASDFSKMFAPGRRKGLNFGVNFEALTFFDIPGARRAYEIVRDAREIAV